MDREFTLVGYCCRRLKLLAHEPTCDYF